MNLLLLSNSSSDAGYLAHALADIRELIAGLPAGAPAVFVPFAGVTRGWDDYTAMVGAALADTGLDVQPLHRAADPLAALENAGLIIVGGGNTFNLLGQLRRQGLLDAAARAPGHALSAGAPVRTWPARASARPTTCPSSIRKASTRWGCRSRSIRTTPTPILPAIAAKRGPSAGRVLRAESVHAGAGTARRLGVARARRCRHAARPHEAPLFLGQQEPRVYAPGALELPA